MTERRSGERRHEQAREWLIWIVRNRMAQGWGEEAIVAEAKADPDAVRRIYQELTGQKPAPKTCPTCGRESSGH
jgi:hypothetical protein